MLVHYILDEGLPVELNTGWSSDDQPYDKVANMQSAIKFLMNSADVAACKVHDIEVYPLGVTKQQWDNRKKVKIPSPLKPADLIPTGSSSKKCIFVHVPRAKQELTPEERRLYGVNSPHGGRKSKVQMARPEIEKLIISPSKRRSTAVNKRQSAQKPKPRKMLQVTVKCLHTGDTFEKMIDPKHTIAQLKEAFAEPSGVAANNQVLHLKDDKNKTTKELQDDSVMAKDAGIQHQSTIYLEPKTINVTVRAGDKDVPVVMKPTDTIQFLKEKVKESTGIDIPDQVLKYHGNLLQQNDKTAREVGLEDGAVIDLLQPFDVIARTTLPDGSIQEIPVTVQPTDQDVLSTITGKVADTTSVPAKDQTVSFQGKPMTGKGNKKMTPHAMGLKQGSVIDVMTPPEKKPEPEPEPEPKKEEAAPKEETKKEDKEGSDSEDDDISEVGSVEIPAHEPKDYSIPFTPTPFDLTRFRCWFMVGDQVPFEMICPIAMTVAEFKVEVLKLRNDARFVERYLRGLDDAALLKVFPAGSWGEGEPLPDDIPLPKDSNPYAFFSVMR